MFVSRSGFINSIENIESVFILQREVDSIYLLADMEYGGIYENARVEEMCFLINPNLPFYQAISECRSNYCGGITFIEYGELDSQGLAVNDFISLKNSSVNFLICNSENVIEELCKSSDKYFYIYIE